jgi:hypothetical protein
MTQPKNRSDVAHKQTVAVGLPDRLVALDA